MKDNKLIDLIECHKSFLEDGDFNEFNKKIKEINVNKYKKILGTSKALLKREKSKVDLIGMYEYLKDDYETLERFYDKCIEEDKKELLSCLYDIKTRKDSSKNYIDLETYNNIRKVDYKKLILQNGSTKEKKAVQNIKYKNNNIVDFYSLEYTYLNLIKKENGDVDFLVEEREEIVFLKPLTILGLFTFLVNYIPNKNKSLTLIHGLLDPNLMYMSKHSDTLFNMVQDALKILLMNTPRNIIYNLIQPYSLFGCLWYENSDTLSAERVEELLLIHDDILTEKEKKGVNFFLEKLKKIKNELNQIKLS
jgi:hypothetical protein